MTNKIWLSFFNKSIDTRIFLWYNRSKRPLQAENYYTTPSWFCQYFSWKFFKKIFILILDKKKSILFKNYLFRFKSRRGSVKCCTLSRLVNKKLNPLFLNFRQPNHAVFDFALSKYSKKGLKSPKNAKKKKWNRR